MRIETWLLGPALFLFATEVSAQNVDCLGSIQAGQNQCSAIAVKPTSVSYGINPVSCNACSDGWLTANCIVMGGSSPNGDYCNNCVGANRVVTATNMAGIADELMVAQWGPCSLMTSVTGWGLTPPFGNNCPPTPLGPTYSFGVLTHDNIGFVHSMTRGPTCAQQLTYYQVGGYNVTAVASCPQGSTSVAGAYCVREQDNTCPVGNPVQPGLGAKKHSETDFALPSPSPLRFTRNYNSFGEWLPFGASNSGHRGGLLGFYWRTNFDRQLYPITTIGANAIAAAYRPDGRVRYFKADGSEHHPDPQQPADRLQKLNPCVTEEGKQVCWRYFTGGDEIESYDASGQLLKIWDRNGLTQRFNWVDNRLLDVTDDWGRKIVFGYEGARRYASRVTDPAGNVYNYGVDDFGRLTSVTYPYTGASPAPKRKYHYENSSFWYALTGITENKGGPSGTDVRFATYGYDANGRVISSAQAPEFASGLINKYTYSYAANGNSTTVTDPLGTARTYNFVRVNGAVLLQSVDQPCTTCGGSNVQSRTYDVAGFLDTSTDFRGTLTDYTFDARGREVQRIDAVNATCPSDEPGCTLEKRTTDRVWDATYNIATSHVIKNINNIVEQKTTYALNSRGQVTARCDIDVDNTAAASYACSAINPPPNNRVRRWTYTYCEGTGGCPLVGQILEVNGPRLPTDAGMGGLDDKTTFEYYTLDDSGCATQFGACNFRKGDLKKTTNAKGHVTEYEQYDRAGRVLRIKDPNLVRTDITYDVRGRLLSRTVRYQASGASDPKDAITQYEYDGIGNLTKTIQPDLSYLSYEYDAANRLLRISDAMGNKLDYCPDAQGVAGTECLDKAGNRRVEHSKDGSNSLRRIVKREFDALGRLYVLRNAQNQPTTMTYDGNGNVTNTEDALSHDTNSSFDRLNRLIKSIGDADTGGIQATTRYYYDARDNLIRVNDPNGLQTHYMYDKLGDLISLQSPDTGTTTYAYDASGQVSSDTISAAPQPGNFVTSYVRDPLGREVTRTYSNGSVIQFTYDLNNIECQTGETYATGQLTRVVDQSGDTKYCYDHRGNLVRRVWQAASGPTLATRWTYTLADKVLRTYYPSGMYSSNFYHPDGRVRRVRVLPVGQSSEVFVVDVAQYEPFGPVKQLNYGFGQHIQTRNWDQNYWPVSISQSLPNTFSLQYGVDAVGNIVNTRTPVGAATPTEQYGYDGLDRLLSIQTPAGAPIEAYTYDATGNRQSKTRSGTTISYAYGSGSHQLAADDLWTYMYAARGLPAYIDGRAGGPCANLSYEIHYDPSTRRFAGGNGAMSCVPNPPYVVADYIYNAIGERANRSVTNIGGSYSQTRAYYVYAPDGRLLAEHDQIGAVIAEYLWLDDVPIGVIVGGTIYHVLADHLNTPRAVVDPAVNVAVWKWDYFDNAFGERTPQTDPDGDSKYFTYNLRFPGQYYDAETGYHYNYFRFYDPRSGRYVESDPIGLAGGLSTFAYADGEPNRLVDPYGLNTIAIGAPVPMPIPNPGQLCLRSPHLCAAGVGIIAGTAIYPVIEPVISSIIEKCTSYPECSPPKGTVCFITDLVPPSKPHLPLEGSHYHLWQMNQNPANGDCFWNKLGVSKSAPPGAIPCPFSRPPR